MAISTEGNIGIGLGLLGLLGAGVLVVAPEPWVKMTGWAMIAIAVVGLLLLAGHHLFDVSVQRRVKRLTQKAESDAPKESLHELHERITTIKTKLEAEEFLYQDQHTKVSFDTFHEVFALSVSLLRLGIPVPFTPEYKELAEYESFNRHTYRYLSAVAPFIQIGDLPLARKWAKSVLDDMKLGVVTNLPGERPQAPAPQGTPERTSPQTSP
jgi:hypothetical protein